MSTELVLTREHPGPDMFSLLEFVGFKLLGKTILVVCGKSSAWSSCSPIHSGSEILVYALATSKLFFAGRSLATRILFGLDSHIPE